MRRSALLTLACALLEASCETTEEPDDEPDFAPFAVVVRRGEGRVCGGALVSQRTVLTSVECVGSDAELSVLAPGEASREASERRVSRVALARGTDVSVPALAVLELKAPFGEEARARPILMATQSAECAEGAACHVVRVARARIVDAALVAPARCAALAPALCVSGPTLCASDGGAGVVCGGKLCGVLGHIVSQRGDECGDTHTAHSVAQSRRFLHCAHTLRACGRGGECAELCSERVPARLSTSPAPLATRTHYGLGSPTRSEPPAAPAPPPLRSSSSSPPTRSKHLAPHPVRSSPPASFEFEPNRADFRAGEYGDNAADYSGEEGGPGGAAAKQGAATPLAPLPAPLSEFAAQRASRAPPPEPREIPVTSAIGALPTTMPLSLLVLLTSVITYIIICVVTN